MRSLLTTLLLAILVSCSEGRHHPQPRLAELYAILDEEIEKSDYYDDLKNSRIDSLRLELGKARSDSVNFLICMSLIDEYEAYNSDSALYYVEKGLANPYILSHPDKRFKLLIKRADIFSHSGLFSDALSSIRTVPRDSVSDSLLEDYYSACSAMYQYLSEYTNTHATSAEYEHQRSLYADSLNQIADTSSFNHLVYVMSENARNGHGQEAAQTLERALDNYHSGSRQYSILASIIAYIYQTLGEQELYEKYLVLSAISDIRGSIKENMSFREVATVMFEDGDIEQANRYLHKSIADANFYSALMRNAQSAKMLPVIDGAYTSMQKNLTDRLRGWVWVTCLLSVVLVITLGFVLMQFVSLRRAHRDISRVNAELSEISEQLSEANEELKKFNVTKEQYAGLFMEYCSTAISTLEHYQRSLRTLTMQGGKREALLKRLESTEITDELLRNFYQKFDEAILNIYPNFVGKFNALLQPDEAIQLKNGELLNRELRIYALIRLGIDDSHKIARFLRSSITTVYTYRSKIKKRALHPETFEDEVKGIE